MSRLTADRLRRAMPEKPCGDPQCDDCDYLRLLEHAARVVEAVERIVRANYPNNDSAEMRLRLDAALEGTEGRPPAGRGWAR